MRKLLWTLGIILAVFVVLALVASPIATAVVNHKLANLPDYNGKVRLVSVAIWKLGVDVEDLALYSKNGDKEQPLVRIKEASLRVALSALFRGKLGGELKLDHPEANIAKLEKIEDLGAAAGEAKDQAKEVAAKLDPWRDALLKAFPIEMTRLEVSEGKLHFSDRSHSPTVDVSLDHVHVLGTGLSNRPSNDELPAKLHLEGVTSGNGKLKLDIAANPLTQTPRFKTNFEITQLNLPDINTLLEAYSKVKASAGTFEFFLEAEAKDGGYQGYVKPFMKDVKFETANDTKTGVVERAARTVANAAMTVLKNKDEQKVGTKAPFSGTFDQNQLDVWTTVQNLLRNAFVQALKEGFDSRNPSKS